MRLKRRIPVFAPGDVVYILEDISTRYRGFPNEVGITSEMIRRQGSQVTIRRLVRENTYEIINDDGRCFWSTNLFQEAYETEEELEEEDTPQEPYIGMYLYHHNHVRGNSLNILLQISDISESKINCCYIRARDPFLKENINDILSYSGRQGFIESINKRVVSRVNYLTDSLFIPTNSQLRRDWGVQNKEVKPQLKEGMLEIPNLFKDSKHPISKLKLESLIGKGYTNPFSSGEYYFEIRKDFFVGYDGKKFLPKLNHRVISRYSLKDKDYKEIVVNWGKAKIKSIERSVELFGHKTRKQAMLDSIVGTTKDGKSVKTSYMIRNVIFNFEKNGNFYHVLEINDGTLNLKFLLDDIDIILPNCNSYIPPKDRTINNTDQCKIINDKLLPVRKGSTVKIAKLFNRHAVNNPMKSYDKNTIAIVVDSNNRQFECKLKQLKKI